jgi:hypothetical protein
VLPVEVLKCDALSRVERVRTRDGSTVRKCYVPRRFFVWRTFLRPAKAKREHDNLRALAAGGLPVTVARCWEETRRFGFVRQSTLWLDDAGAVENLKEAFRRGDLACTHRRLVSAFGTLLRRLHAAGFVSLTAYPRNVLVTDAAHGELVLCDQPYLLCWRKAVQGAVARIDLFDALFTPGRARDLSRADKLRALQAYAGDRAHARALWRTLTRRRVTWQRFVKGSLKIVRCLGLFAVPRVNRP